LVYVVPEERGVGAAVLDNCRDISSFGLVKKMVRERAARKLELTEIVNRKETLDLLKRADMLNTVFTGKGKCSLSLLEIVASVKKTEHFGGLERGRIAEVIQEGVVKLGA
jgi:hypothetical protein